MQLSLITVVLLFGSAVAFLPTKLIKTSNARVQNINSGLTMKLFDWKRRGEVPLKADEGVEFNFTNLRPAPGSKKRKTRKGRGIAAGQGASCGFGMRGQNSRAGPKVRAGFEGGQTPLYRRIPKIRGKPLGPGHKRVEYDLIKTQALNGVAEGSTVSFASLLDAGIVTKGKYDLFKFVCDGEVSVKGLTVEAHAFTKTAQEAIENAGGKCVLVSRTTGQPLEA